MKKSEKISEINAQLTADLAREKVKMQEAVTDYHKRIADLYSAAAEMKKNAQDDEDCEDEQSEQNDAPAWLDGSQLSAMLVARRIIKKMPKIPEGCTLDVSISRLSGDDVNVQLEAYNKYAPLNNRVHSVKIYSGLTPELQKGSYELWRNAVDYHFAQGKEVDNE